jgi:hypothetical protein
MSWVKRNLYFLVGGVVAVALLGLAGFYIYSKWRLNNESLSELNAAYEQLDQLAASKPNPGNDTINNIEIAGVQEKAVRAIIDAERKFFQAIQPIPTPAGKTITKEEFASALRRTLDDLEHNAKTASVTVPNNYSFTFEAERSLAVFQGQLEPLAVKLGEVKAICAILYKAKINSLDNLRRCRVSLDDVRGPAADYLEDPAVTNRLGVVTPYELSFHCFSTELADVLAGFANSPNCFVVKAINVEPGGSSQPAPTDSSGAPMWGAPPPPAPAPVAKGGLPVLVDEKQLKVTLKMDLITLLPKK